LEEQETVAQEMSHRLKNLFAMTDGMIHGSAKSADTPQAMAGALSGRIHALASAHSLVRRKISDLSTSPATTDLNDLIRAVVGAHVSANGRDASSIRLDGPPVSCGDHASNGIALVIHELATNASKYGALKNEDGSIEIGWQILGDKVVLKWEESGGPPIESAPTLNGFGSTLMQRTIKGQFRGVLQRDWRPHGLAVMVTLSLSRMST